MRKDWPQNQYKEIDNKKNLKELIDIKAFNYYTSLKVLYMWIPVIAPAMLAASYNKSTRLILVAAVGGVLFRYMVKHLNDTAIVVTFTPESMIYKDRVVNLSDIQDYYMCTNIEKYFLFRIKTKKGKKHVLHIDVNYMSEIELYLKKHKIQEKHKFSDNLIRMAGMIYAFPLMLVILFFAKLFGIL
ncbi:hypothetical protein [Myroides odoratimimus]|uniref:hypothetical protein n=1 Tax=Myroides odoratimimus TaxID=76832 RepID=UPI0004686872|nr:hypothetical protein [Myroides odoratimimus]